MTSSPPRPDVAPGTLPPLPLDDLAAAYDRNGLDRLDDRELVDAVVAVVAQPRRDPADSFVLHAPLEIMARARLLERTPPPLRRLARLRILSIAARYRTHPALEPDGDDAKTETETLPATSPGGVPLDLALDELAAAVDRGDLVAVDRTVRALVAAGPDPVAVADGLAPVVLTRTSAAAHAPIHLAGLIAAGADGARWLPLLRPLVRELARGTDRRITWIDDLAGDRRASGPEDPGSAGPGSGRLAPSGPVPAADVDLDALTAPLLDPPRLGLPGDNFVHPLIAQVDRGPAPDLLRTALGPGSGPVAPAAVNRLLRIAALAMVRDDPAHASYGWTHCFTLPRAVLTLGSRPDGDPRALAVAATQILAFRAGEGSTTLDPADPLLPAGDGVLRDQGSTLAADTAARTRARREALVVEAARRHDAHIAKYIDVILTTAEADPAATELYLTAAEHLLAVWDAAGPDPDDPLAGEG